MFICASEIHGKRNGSFLWALKSLMRFLRQISLLVTRNADWKVWGLGGGERERILPAQQFRQCLAKI